MQVYFNQNMQQLKTRKYVYFIEPNLLCTKISHVLLYETSNYGIVMED